MKNRQVGKLNKSIVGVTFLIMVTVNALANILPINGVNTGQVSDSLISSPCRNHLCYLGGHLSSAGGVYPFSHGSVPWAGTACQ